MKKKTIISSLAYKFTERLLVKGLGLVISVVLARLLSPDDFGQLAILAVFINLSQTIIQSGMNTALVQSKEIDKSDYSTVFYLSFGLATILIIVLFFCAPAISLMYESEALIAPLRVYALSLLFGAFNSVQVAKLQREMKFKATMVASLIATVVSGSVGIILAYLGAGIWALVFYNFAYIVCSCFTMLLAAKWFPAPVFSIKRARKLFNYGGKMFVSAMLCSLYNDIRTLIIGKKFSTEDLGYYNRGQQFPGIISMTLDSSIQSVMFPALSSVQDQATAVRAMQKKSLGLGALMAFPVMIGLALVAEPFIRLLLTEKWLPCVIYMQYLCVADASITLCSSNLVAIKSVGRSDIYMYLEIIRRILMIIILTISVVCFHSVEAIAIGYVISSWLDAIVIAIPMKKITGYGLLEQIKGLWKIGLATLVMAVAVVAVNQIVLPTVVSLLVSAVTGGIVYIIACWLLREENFNYVIKTMKGFLKKKDSIQQ